MVKNVSKRTGRNDTCPCGSGKKFKKCCQNGMGWNTVFADLKSTNVTPEKVARMFLSYVGTGYLYATEGKCGVGDDLAWAAKTIAESKEIDQYDSILVELQELIDEGVFIANDDGWPGIMIRDRNQLRRTLAPLIALALPKDLGVEGNCLIAQLTKDWIRDEPLVELTTVEASSI